MKPQTLFLCRRLNMETFVHNEEPEISMEHLNIPKAPAQISSLKNRNAAESGNKLYMLVGVGFGFLCILQVAVNISLRLSHYSSDHQPALRTRCTNLSDERDELRIQMKHFDDLFQQGWIYFSHRFYYVSPIKKNWQESQDDCLARDAHLVIINSNEEQEFSKIFNRPLWIGLTDRETEGIWKWVDGTPLTIRFWNAGQANHHHGETQDCVEIAEPPRLLFFLHQGNDWNDVPCGKQNFWMCEKTQHVNLK
ncbi:CD209 antigen-like protein C [Thalassophryne amazonica]|uniref:CD209 antigen-like protein C n=1 Tax=Thalassophryne amazonica TaxID=390379 RepID=UPI0014721D19|nr:CD209 antigen-like protein C [Thalassophryne amazonica]